MSSAILYENMADPENGANVTASSWIAAAPPSLLQNVHVSRRWQGNNGGQEYVLCTWDSSASIDTVGLFGITGVFDGTESFLTDAATTRLRISSSDPLGLAGDLYDSGDESDQISDAYGVYIKLLPEAVEARAVRIDFGEASASALSAGRLVIGTRNTFTYNFGIGWSFGFNDLSRKRKSAGGLSFIDKDDRYRVVNLTFEALTSEDRYGFVQTIDRLNGVSTDVLMILDEASDRLDRDCIWGLIQDMAPPSQPNIWLFKKSYQLEERR